MHRVKPGTRRADAMACYRAALAAVDPERLVREALTSDPLGLEGDERLWVIAIGKAASRMIRGVLASSPGRVYGGLGVTIPGGSDPRLPAIRWFEGGHPLPDEGSVRAGRAIERFASELGPRDRVLALVSGGGSACLSLPAAGVELDEIVRLTRNLSEAGADIRELNAVRRRLDRAKGGGLARLFGPSLLRTLVLSDVPYATPGLVASGPFGGEVGELPEPASVLRGHGLLEGLSKSAREALLAEPGTMDDADVRVLADWRTVAAAAAEEASRHGWRVEIAPDAVRGEAREVGRSLGRRLRALAERGESRCLVGAGETTVVVRGGGRGGRNQELVLGAAPELAELPDVLVASVATDGADGASPAAGGFADGTTAARARELDAAIEESLRENDSFGLLDRLGDTVVTGPTGTNVLDLTLGFVGEASADPEYSGKHGR